ncbi:Peroxisomal targeting signal 2 receptor [Geodia barretti]|uniref:Peroxin-7 n=1 Tax=Geodia barretti TaxID=519541 RepID=A0AA35TLI7_GEOBA|nr:Peroxisomal targeting signal 2 receptor [Geodia barretti]
MAAAGNVEVVNTAPYHGYQVLFSPYSPTKIAFTGAQNYGIQGSGVLSIFEEGANGFRDVVRFPWRDAFFGVTWSEVNEAVLVVACGDGSIVIFDQSQPQAPVSVLSGHTAEVSTVEWSIGRQEQLLLSSSWDTTVRLWDPNAQTCVSVFTGHSGIVYEAAWAPHLPHTFASVSADGRVLVWDSSQRGSSSVVCGGGGGEVLACDWSKYDSHSLVTAGTDACIKGWDVRRPLTPLFSFPGHTQSVRRVKCDPFHRHIVASSSYDFSVRLWDVHNPHSPLLDTILHHTEFTYGLSFSPFIQGRLADCSWDSTIKLYSPPAIALQEPAPSS